MALFDIPNDEIRNLDELGLPELVYRIMYYEVAKLNLLNKGLHISLNTKTGDGGSDGEFNSFNKPIPSDHPFLPEGSIVFQFKAASIADKAWFEKEILTDTKKDLKPKLKELIADGYTYILITNKTDLPAQKLDEKEKTLKEVFNSVGYKDITVKIIDLSKLAEWANSIPQIYLNFNPDTKYFELFENYEYEVRQSSEDIEYFNDKKREDGILQIQNQIKTTLSEGKSSFIRIEGFSGIGKTRFVFEALNDETIKDFVLYIQSYRDNVLSDLISFCKKLPANSQEQVIFVVDECPYEEHIQICRRLKTYSNIVVITIDQVLSSQDTVNCRDEFRFTLEGLSEEKTVELIQNVNSIIPKDIAEKIAYYTEGYPRLAKFMAESYDIEKGDTSETNEKEYLLDRILDKVTNNTDELKLLQAISIFKMFPNTDDLRTYKSIIFDHFMIDSASASITIEKLVKKGIIRKAGRFLYISPRPISIHLFNKFLEIYDYDFIDDLFKKLNNQGLMNNFFDRLHGVPFDSSQHKDLLHQILSSLTYDQVTDDLGSKIFYYLCLKDKKYSIYILNKLLNDKTKEELLTLEGGRRYLVFALENLISFRETFNDSAKLLFKLARAENESWGNNSKGVFINSFQWILGGTETNIINRLELLQQLYETYTGDEDRKILLDALNNSYPKFHYSATNKNHSNIPENIPEHYHPKTQKEVDDYFEKLKVTIQYYYDNASKELQENLVNNLIHSLRSFLSYHQIEQWILDFIEKELDNHNHLKSIFFEQISSTLKYDKDEKLSKNTLSRLEKINSQFFSTSNIEDVKKLFFTTSQYRYNSDEDFDIHTQMVVNDILIHKDFQRLLDTNTENTFIIGHKLAELDKDNRLYNEIINLLPKIDETKDLRFIRAYLLNSKMGKEENHKALLDEIYNKLNDKSLLFDFIHSIHPKSKAAINYLYLLLEQGEIKSSSLENLTLGFWLRDFEKDEFIEFIDHINIIIKDKCDSFDLAMQYILHKDKKDIDLIKKYTDYYITNNIFKCTDQHRIYYEIDKAVDEYFLHNLSFSDAILEKVWDAILYEFEDDAKFEKREFVAIYKIIYKYPHFFWEKIKDKLEELQPQEYFLYRNFVTFLQGGYMSNWFKHSLFNYINSDDVISWLKTTKFENAKYIIADSLNIDFESETLPDIVIKILTEFAGDEDLYSSIKCNSESWTGSYVPVANEKIDNINIMLEKYKENESVIDFLNWAKKIYEHHKERAQRDDEERRI